MSDEKEDVLDFIDDVEKFVNGEKDISKKYLMKRLKEVRKTIKSVM